MQWDAPARPAELAETRLISAILDSHFAISSNLPGERELAARLGVTRPTLREALQRLARDGWVEIRQGRATRVRDYWREGNLGVLSAIAHHQDNLPATFVPNLLQVRVLLAPTYTRLAFEQSLPQVTEILAGSTGLADTPEAFAEYDLRLHAQLTILSGNPVFTLILNGFGDLYLNMARRYFAAPQARAHSRAFYARLLSAAQASDAALAETVTQAVMQDSVKLWQAAVQSQGEQK
jgi:GntR family negative regulator for fad regulon and positive regulator of fabA